VLSNKVHFGESGIDIILLPGIMGSELSDRKGPFGKIWLDKLRLIGGDFSYLALDAEGRNDLMKDSSQQPEGLLKMTYLKAEAWLEQRGHRVHPFPYDWRRAIDTSARGLNDFVEGLTKGDARKTFVSVAHSMGGLVTRRYLARRAW
jgi:pimeloyl-ACP methyl ester carboxylesterase